MYHDFSFFFSIFEQRFRKIGEISRNLLPDGYPIPDIRSAGITRRVSAIPEPEPDPTFRYPHPPETRLFATRPITSPSLIFFKIQLVA